MPDLSETARYLNTVLALYIVGQAVRPDAVAWWRSRPAEVRFLLLGLLGMTIATGWGTVEVLAQSLPFGSRVLILTIALAWTATGITLLHTRLRKDTPVNTHRATSTQARHPWRATLRTIVAYLAIAGPALLVIIPIIQDELGPYLPDGWSVGLTGAAAVLAALIGMVTRIMAIPGVQKLLDMIGLGTGDD